MKTLDIRLQMLMCGCALFLGTATVAWAEAVPQPRSGDGLAFGVVTGIVGTPVKLVTAIPAASRSLKVGDVVASGDELRVGAGEKLDLLWDHRAVLTLHEEARLNIHEPHHGQTEVRLQHGMVRIALSYNAGRMTDTLTLETPLARVVSRGGILEATVLGGQRRSLFARLVNAPPVESLRVFEGQARVEPLTGEGPPFLLKTGSEVSLKEGAAHVVSEIQMDRRGLQPLAVREEHRRFPSPVMQQIVSAQVGVALDVEKRLQETPTAESEKDLPGTIVKGAVLSTSTGFPLVPGIQVSAAGNPTGGTSLPTSPSVAPPPGASPIQGAGTASLGPAQSGGLNSSGLLMRILNDVGKGTKGRGKK